jgi:hypothetical protein
VTTQKHQAKTLGFPSGRRCGKNFLASRNRSTFAEGGKRLIWVERAAVDRLRAMRLQVARPWAIN